MPPRSKKKSDKLWYTGYAFAYLRRIFAWSPEKKIALKRQEHGFGMYRCESCTQPFPKNKVHTDHKNPVVDPLTGFTTWDSYITRLFCSADNLQILCVDCHKVKTAKEAKIRKEARKSK